MLRAPLAWRLWSPVIGIAVGCAVAVPFGLYHAQQVLDAPWFGISPGAWPGLDLTPGPQFWALLPVFVVVTLVGAVEKRHYSSSVRHQKYHGVDIVTVQVEGSR